MGRDLSHITRRCERAVVTAYRDLRAYGRGDLESFQACTALYRIHHPEASLNEARRLVAEWIDHHVIRGEAGPTPGCDCTCAPQSGQTIGGSWVSGKLPTDTVPS